MIISSNSTPLFVPDGAHALRFCGYVISPLYRGNKRTYIVLILRGSLNPNRDSNLSNFSATDMEGHWLISGWKFHNRFTFKKRFKAHILLGFVYYVFSYRLTLPILWSWLNTNTFLFWGFLCMPWSSVTSSLHDVR